MGQRKTYLNSNPIWSDSHSFEERLKRWWHTASFGLALSGRASSAVAASNRAVAIAEAAQTMVLHQAVYALLAEKRSVREIATALSLSRSKAGRIVKLLTHGLKDGEIASVGFLAPMGADDETEELVLAAWRFESLADAIWDHPRGALDPEPRAERLT